MVPRAKIQRCTLETVLCWGLKPGLPHAQRVFQPVEYFLWFQRSINLLYGVLFVKFSPQRQRVCGDAV